MFMQICGIHYLDREIEREALRISPASGGPSGGFAVANA
jgi:hypothetical protein